ncbi:MAG TPA: AMP-dependent synthetase/ligase [Solirubrobacterales bacterium]|nr:AMP-dependent synthetase/ligase [Solirubrobacterales bacterium]
MESGTVEQVSADQPAALSAATLCEAFQITAAERPGDVALRTPGGAVEITWRELSDRVRRIAAGLASLGVQRGDTLALMLVNRPEFNVADAGAMHLGATAFSVYNTCTPEQVEFLFGNAGNRVVITERQFLPVVRAAQQSSPGLEHVVLVDGEEEGTISLDRLEQMGDAGFDFEAAWRAVEPDDVLTLIYTSGTTGPPKGVQLTHRNLMAEIRGVADRLPTKPGGRIVSFLPSAHVADRWASQYQSLIVFGFTLTCLDDPRAIIQTLPEVRPTAWGSVPRIWEKLKAGLEAQGLTDPAALPEEHKAAVRAKLGLDECSWLVVGAAPTPVEVLAYFDALGLPICELWGMSETSSCATINPPGAIKVGTCGTPILGVELKLAEDGELLVRGEVVMTGYRGDPEKTREALDPDGWLHTGDIAEIDDDGYVKIVDRKKELIINAAGKNMSPVNIEARLKSAHPLIGTAVAIGDRRPYNVALVVLDPDVTAAFASEHGIEDASAAAMAQNESVQEAIKAAVEEANSHLSRVEQIKKFAILGDEWQPGGEELTPTMKLKRKPIAEKYAAEIERLYA